MGMSIDLTIEDVIDVLSMIQKSVPYTNANDEEADILKRSLNKAVDTMNKYQKIEQLVKFYKNAGEIPIFVLEGVLKDGKDNIYH